MSDLISRAVLYERAASLEAQALAYVGKLIERDGEEPSVEWKIWSAILNERTAFKHDVYDAPSAEPERKKGKWSMKTLDEVIWAVENCDSAIDDCAHCPYYKEDCENLRPLRADALHYLKEYREKLDAESALPDYYELVNFWAESQANPPLTWDELKQMEWKPVFVEERYRNGDLKSAGWWLVDYWNDDQICVRDQGGNPWNAHRTSLGRDWQAYRKERE